jgi:predicted ATP-dependent protease
MLGNHALSATPTVSPCAFAWKAANSSTSSVEVDIGGQLHSKGVLILWPASSAQRYCDASTRSRCRPPLAFEQSLLDGVDGDSASSAELYALLSAISDVRLIKPVASPSPAQSTRMARGAGRSVR